MICISIYIYPYSKIVWLLWRAVELMTSRSTNTIILTGVCFTVDYVSVLAAAHIVIVACLIYGSSLSLSMFSLQLWWILLWITWNSKHFVYVVLFDSLHYARTYSTYLSFLAEAFRCIEKLLLKNSSKLNKFLHSEVNRIIQHIIVQNQDGQNNNILYPLPLFMVLKN